MDDGESLYQHMADIAHMRGYLGMPEYGHTPNWFQRLMQLNAEHQLMNSQPQAAPIVKWHSKVYRKVKSYID